VQKARAGQAGWRVSATGVVTAVEAAPAVVKKLKLVGHPFKASSWLPLLSYEVKECESVKMYWDR